MDNVFVGSNAGRDVHRSISAKQIDFHPMTRGTHDIVAMQLQIPESGRTHCFACWPQNLDDGPNLARLAIDDFQKRFANFVLEPIGQLQFGSAVTFLHDIDPLIDPDDIRGPKLRCE
jgi:hypothetical protein